jgi:hypothetical protein
MVADIIMYVRLALEGLEYSDCPQQCVVVCLQGS